MIVMQVHISAPAHCWSSRTETAKWRCSEKYTGYTTRSQKTRNPERMSHGSVARKRYRRIDQLGRAETLGQGRTMGHQKRNPTTTKLTCSTTCHPSDCSPSVNAAGRCHPINAVVAANQQNIGCESTCPARCSLVHFNNGPRKDRTNRRGRPCNNGITGAPIKINGGAMLMSSRC